MQPTVPMMLSKVAQEGIIQYHRQAYQQLNQQWNMREYFRQIDLAYISEQDWTRENRRAQIANRYGDADKLQDITVPIVMPLVESAVEYQSSVFLTGIPIFGVVADPAYEDQAMQLETVIDNNATRGGWTRELMMFFRDGFKYNFSCLEVTWDREVTATLETDLSYSPKQGKPKEVIWNGNVLKRRDPYNVFFDSRVPITEHYKRGEFAGYTDLMSRIELKMFVDRLLTKTNVKEAFESGMGSAVGGFGVGGIESYYVPQVNFDAMLNKNPRATTDWMAWAGISGADLRIQYHNMYEVTVLYGRIIPSDFKISVPAPNTPQVWKFIIVNHNVIIYAERQTNAHGYIPLFFGQPLEDGLMYQTKSVAKNVLPFQNVTSALLKSVIASRRRAISDRTLYDPSRISEAQINNPNPSAKIPVRPAAYGKNISESVYAFPFRDDQASVAMGEISQFIGMSDKLVGQNQAQQGQFVKGNKTLHEYADVMKNANGKSQMISMLLEAQVFTPIKEVLKINIMQYQEPGQLAYNRVQNKQIQIDPVALRNAVLNFKLSDGLTPTDKLINGDTLQVSMQVIGSSPQIGSGYNLAPLFSYLMKTQGANLTPFEKSPQQVAYEQAVQQWQQIAQTVAQQGGDMSKLPPQPKPQDYGYDPQSMGSSATTAPIPQPRVNNTIENIAKNTQTANVSN